MEKQIQILKDAIIADYARFTKRFSDPETQVANFAANITFQEGSKYIKVLTEGLQSNPEDTNKNTFLMHSRRGHRDISSKSHLIF